MLLIGDFSDKIYKVKNKFGNIIYTYNNNKCYNFESLQM